MGKREGRVRYIFVFGTAFVVSLACGAGTAFAQDPLPPQPQPAPTYYQYQPPPPQPAPPPQAPAPAPEPERKSQTQFGIGPGYAAVIPLGASSSQRAGQAGLVLEVAKTVPVADRFDFGFRFAWGFTAWDRFPKWAKAGYDVGKWTTTAYEDTYNWTRKRGADGDSDPNTHGLRLTGGLVAMAFLWLGYVVSGITYLAAVVSPTTWMEIDLTGGYNFGDKDVNPYLKAGIGLMGFIHPEHGTLLGGVGPTFGGGIKIGSALHLGANVTWSPPPLHGEARSGQSHLLVGGLTIGVQN
jgi:hypothetical protein